MFESKPQEMNRQNLIDISTALTGVEHFVFFGTLLGLVREGDIIPHDDDVDFYVPIEQREAVIKRLRTTDFIIDMDSWPNHTNYFLQAYRVIDGIKTYVDFYLFETDDKKDCLLDRWNFHATTDNPDLHLYTPRELIYPLKTQKFFDYDIPIPAKGEALCAFLYGANWRRPMRKGQSLDAVAEKKIKKYKRDNKALLLIAAAMLVYIITR